MSRRFLTWFLTEANEAAQSVTWNSDKQRVDSLPAKAQKAIDALLRGLEVEHQSWEILDNFDTPDGTHSANNQHVIFELANHFSLAPGVNHTSLKDNSSTKSFTAGKTNATRNVAALTEAEALAA